MKKFIFLLALLLFVNCCVNAEPSSEQTVLTDLTQIYSHEISKGIAELQDVNFDDFMPDFNINSLIREATSGKFSVTPRHIINTILKIIFKEIYASSKIMLLLVAIAILCSILTNLSGNLQAGSVSNVALFTCTMVISGISLSAFQLIIKASQNAVENMVLFMRILVPVLISVLISSGATVTASMFQPWLIAAIEITVAAIKDILVPMLMLSTALTVIGCLSDRFSLTKFAELISKSVKWGIGILATAFIGMMGLQSLVSSAVDGLSVRVAKFAVSNFIPVVGGILSDSVETVMGCGLVIKNAVGVIGMIIVVFIASAALAKLAAQLIIFRFSTAVIQPIVDAKIVNCVSSLADSLAVMFSLVSAVAIMFIISLTIAINAGSSAIIMGR